MNQKQTAISMRRVMPGLYASEDVRAERRDGGWRAEVKLRDCGKILGKITDLYEYDRAGLWHPVGSYRTLAICEEAAIRLRRGTHAVRGTEGRIVPFKDIVGDLQARTS